MQDLTAGQLVELTLQYINVDQLEEAVKAGQQAVTMVPDYTEADFVLGRLFLPDRREDALTCYGRVLEAVPDHLVIDQVTTQGAYEAIIPVIKGRSRTASCWRSFARHIIPYCRHVILVSFLQSIGLSGSGCSFIRADPSPRQLAR